MPASTRRVVLTGANGRVGTLLRARLSEQYQTVLLDRDPIEGEANGESRSVVADLSEYPGSYLEHFESADSVVHCAFGFQASENSTTAQFQLQIANLNLARNVYQTCLDSGVRRLVMCSTNHVADFYEPYLLDGRISSFNLKDRPFSRGLYGWAQEASEHLGFVYAVGDAGGRQLHNVQIRIGCPVDVWPPPAPGTPDYEQRRRRWIVANCS